MVRLGLLFSTFLLSCSILTKGYPFYNVDNTSTGTTKLYVYFSDLTARPDKYEINASLFTIDGKSEQLTGKYVETNNISNNELKDRLYSFDIDPVYTSVNFTLLYQNYKYLTTPLYKISGSIFVLDSQSYNVSKKTGFGNISISTRAFADYFASRIDTTTNQNDYYAYYIYNSLEKNVYKNITDYSDDYSKSIIWFDEYENKNVSLSEKWDLISKKFKNKSILRIKSIWLKILGVFILSLCVGGVVALILYEKWRNKKRIY